MRRSPALLALSLLLIAAGMIPMRPAGAENAADHPLPRVEARSATLLAVGIVDGDRMAIHVSRLIDNSPVRNAGVTVLLRGIVHPTTAEADGSYTLQTKDLSLPGSASVIFQVALENARQDLAGSLQIADNLPKGEEKNSARQLWWWVLNFAVCIGFLVLISRRRKAASQD